MEQVEIKKLSELQSQYAEQTAALLVERFYEMFRGISKQRSILQRLFLPCLQADLFYVLLQHERVAGFIAVSDADRRAIMIREDTCIGLFGVWKGRILARQLRRLLSTPAVTKQDQGYIDFIATAPEMQRRGVAAKLLAYAEQSADFSSLSLDVLTSNHSAISLYGKSGYKVDSVQKNIWMRLAGIKAMNVMKKELK